MTLKIDPMGAMIIATTIIIVWIITLRGERSEVVCKSWRQDLTSVQNTFAIWQASPPRLSTRTS
jgi:hypothetical protein